MNCLTQDEQRVLFLIIGGQILDNGDMFSKNKLLAKGLIDEYEGQIRIAQPLFNAYLKSQNSKPTILKKGPFIRHSSELEPIHIVLLKELIPNMEYIECKLMQKPRPNDAVVYMVSGEDSKGSSIRPCVVKINSVECMNREVEKTEKARILLGPVVPLIKNEYSLKGQKAILYEYATADNRDFEVKQFVQFYTENSTEPVVDVVKKLFRQTLFPLYKNSKVEEKSAKDFYALPKKNNGDYEKLSAKFRTLNDYDASTNSVLLFGTKYLNPGNILKPPDSGLVGDYDKLFVNKRRIGISSIHNDLNPRNFLIDGIGNIHVIDFAIYKENGARFTDLAHLEASIKFKINNNSDKNNYMQFASIEKLLVNSQNESDLALICNLPLDVEFYKMVAVIKELRCSGMSLGDPKDNFIDIEYKIALLTQTLRLVLYEEYLSDFQQKCALLSASFLHNYLISIIDKTHNN